MPDLTGRVALVTGGARGQGRAHALALAEAGAQVVVTDIDGPATVGDSVGYPLATATDLDDTVAEIVARGGRAAGCLMDVRDSAAIGEVFGWVDATFGRLDVLIANAGIMNFGEIEHLDDARWEAMLATNLTGVFHCVRAAVPLMARHRFGRIVATASTVGRGGFSHLGHYAASKWGLIGLIKSLALEVGDRGITANVIAPATVDTPMVMNPMAYRKFRPELDDPTRDDAAEVLATWGPLGVPWLDVADTTRAMMYFVADPGHSTGTVLEVNLGLTAAKF